MKDFVFIIPLTPKRLLNPVRQTLFDMMIFALKKQTSDNWNALLIGEEERQDGNLIYINSEKSLVPSYVKEFRGDPGHTDKHHKIEIALQHIALSEPLPKYLIRLDDDDLISPAIISTIEKTGMEYDCYADKYQALYNVMDGKIALPHLTWMANSIFHKYEHAITYINLFNHKLINCSHSEAFHIYYADKKVFYSPKFSPLYLRILSETCLNISANANATLQTQTTRFGFWHYYSLKEYELYIEMVVNKFQTLLNITILRKNSPFLHTYSLTKYWFNRVKKKINREFQSFFSNNKN